jgi:hypothetical protein
MLGVIAGALMFTSSIAVLLGVDEQDGLHALFSLPEGAFEASFAIYLIVMDFRPSAVSGDAPPRSVAEIGGSDEVSLERDGERLDLAGHPLRVEPRDGALKFALCRVEAVPEALRHGVGDRHLAFGPALAAAQAYPPVLVAALTPLDRVHVVGAAARADFEAGWF